MGVVFWWCWWCCFSSSSSSPLIPISTRATAEYACTFKDVYAFVPNYSAKLRLKLFHRLLEVVIPHTTRASELTTLTSYNSPFTSSRTRICVDITISQSTWPMRISNDKTMLLWWWWYLRRRDDCCCLFRFGCQQKVHVSPEIKRIKSQ